MAQVSLRACVCEQSPGTHYCLECEQYFCDHCKAVHKKVKLTQNHKFQAADEAIPEVKSKCEDHDEDFTFYCTSCDSPVCGDCITGTHHGHKFKKIKDIVTDKRNKMEESLKPKLEKLSCQVDEIVKGMRTFETETKSIRSQVEEDRFTIIALVKSRADQMVKDMLAFKEGELTKLRKIESETKIKLKQGQSLETELKELEDKLPDATLHQKLSNLQDQIDLLETGSRLQCPKIGYIRKCVSAEAVTALFGDYQLNETEQQEEDDGKNKDIDDSEVLLGAELATVWHYDKDQNKWQQTGSVDGHGISNVGVYAKKNRYRIVARRIRDKEVVINCYLPKGLKYNSATATFHQFRVPGNVYGLNFNDKESAIKFEEIITCALMINY